MKFGIPAKDVFGFALRRWGWNLVDQSYFDCHMQAICTPLNRRKIFLFIQKWMFCSTIGCIFRYWIAYIHYRVTKLPTTHSLVEGQFGISSKKFNVSRVRSKFARSSEMRYVGIISLPSYPERGKLT